jgi:hypothetical protein
LQAEDEAVSKKSVIILRARMAQIFSTEFQYTGSSTKQEVIVILASII